jgi:pimeloyl-ACP methyl ester carboxylesterase
MCLSLLLILLALLPMSISAFSSPAVPSSSASTIKEAKKNPLAGFDVQTNTKLPWIQDGYQTWTWKDHNINYIEMGDPTKPAIVLIHGFGASSYHWRYNLPDLAKDYHVFAFCKLGFGLSSKPIQEYTPEVWRDQALDFLKEIVQKPATLAGNSLGGFTSLYTAATDEAKSMVNGVILLNGAGRFRDGPVVEEKKVNPIIEAIQTAIQRLVIGASFVFTKQPARIAQVLRQVYPVDNKNVDEELVESIRYPSLDPNAAEVFYRVITKNGSGPSVFVDDLLANLECPLLLCWGEYDPWIRPQAADRVQALYPAAQRVSIDAGHCPHDEGKYELIPIEWHRLVLPTFN